MAQDDLLFDGVQSTLDWLNTPPDDAQWEDVRKALRRKQFALPIKNKVKNPLETTLL